MPTIKSRYNYTKVWRPSGTRFAESGLVRASSFGLFRTGENRTVVSITGVAAAIEHAARRALISYMNEFHLETGIPEEVLDSAFVVEVIVARGGVSARVLVLPEEAL